VRRTFLETFKSQILEPRELDYRMVFPGPAGNNAVEAALKLARKVTGRESVVNFTNAFHGMTLGALSVTGNSMKRGGAGIPLVHATPMPYDDYFNQDVPDFLYLERLLTDAGSGLNKPGAIIVETVQGEGGIHAARAARWLLQLRGGRDLPGHRHAVEVHQRIRPADGADPHQAGAGHLGAGRAQRHLPWYRSGLRHGHQGHRAVLERR